MIISDNVKCCLYYKCAIASAQLINYAPRVVSYALRVMLQIMASLTIVNMFIVLATDLLK